jgi:hypothetical protein
MTYLNPWICRDRSLISLQNMMKIKQQYDEQHIEQKEVDLKQFKSIKLIELSKELDDLSEKYIKIKKEISFIQHKSSGNDVLDTCKHVAF